MLKLKLTDYRRPNVILALTTDTEIEISGVCELRYISIENECSSVTLFGDGKLQLHPKRKGYKNKWYPEYEEVKNEAVCIKRSG